MPQLTKAIADQAEKEAWDPNEAPPSNFVVLEDGDYIVRLLSVEVSDNVGPSGYHYWNWKFEEVNSGNWIWTITSLSPKALGSLGQMFAAFGVPADTPTESLLGDCVGATVSKVVQAKGKREGEWTNQIETVWPAAEHDDYDPDSHGKAAVGGGRTAAAEDFGGDEPDEAPAPVKRAGKRVSPKAGGSEESF